jgi:transcriptional regulator with XRE-family HTH domain
MEEKNLQMFDKKVGQLIRRYRRIHNVSQAKLGQDLGVSFQQIQKYESAQNRVSVSAFQQIKKSLNIPLEAIFDTPSTANVPDEALIDLKLVRALSKVRNNKTKQALIHLIQTMGEED